METMTNKKTMTKKMNTRHASTTTTRRTLKAGARKNKFFVAIDPDGFPVTTTFRDNKESCIKVLTQGSKARWNKYSKEGYRIKAGVQLYSNGQPIF